MKLSSKPVQIRITNNSTNTPLKSLAMSLNPGQWGKLNVLGLTTSLFNAPPNNTLGYMDKGCYDPINRQVRFIGQAHGGDQRYHQFDETTNTYSNLPDPAWDNGGSGAPSYIGHGYQHNAMDPLTGNLYYRLYNSSDVYKLNRTTNQWSTIARAPNTEITGALEWLPSIGSTGGLILFLGQSCHRWDQATNSWSTPAYGTITGMTYHSIGVLSVPNQVVLFGGGNGGPKLWKIGATGGATACAPCPAGFGINQSVTTACPKNGELISIRSNSVAYKYSVASNTWSNLTLNGAPSFGTVSAGSHIIATPIEKYGVILFTFGNSAEAWVYKHS